VECSRCGRKENALALCKNGHFVCDECHRQYILTIVERECVKSEIRHPIELAKHIFQLQGLHMHGPEYHSIVPAIIVTAYNNIIEKEKNAMVKEAIERGKAIQGGVCGSHGACGAGIGAGIACSVIYGVTPYSSIQRGGANRLTACALMEISRYGGPRCCKRDSVIALYTAMKHFPQFEAMPRIAYVCGQYMDNTECIRKECPRFPHMEEKQSACNTI
jgi:hypothetical protein